MEERWDLQALSRVLDGLLGFLSEFGQDWVANDLRAAAFKLLLGWLLLSLLAIQLAWRTYGHTVTDLYHRQGTGGQNGGTPDAAPHLSGWESSVGEALKTHRE